MSHRYDDEPEQPMTEQAWDEIAEAWAKIRASQPRHIPRSLPEWMHSDGCCEIDARDEAWSRSGREIH